MPDQELESLLASVREWIIPLVLILIGAILALRFLRPLVHRLLAQILDRQVAEGTERALSAVEIQKRIDTLESLVVAVARFIVVILAIVLILAVLNLGPVVAALGLALAAFAFAGQDIVRDYLTGFYILAENQFYKGDVVRIAGVSGTVEDVALRRTTLRDLSGEVHIVSNGEIRVASNLTRIYARINLDIDVAYGNDVEHVTAVIDGVGREMATDPAWRPRILEAPAVLRVQALGQSGVTFKVVGSVRAGEQWAATGELRKRLLAAFARDGIQIPYPHQVVINRFESAADEAADPFRRLAIDAEATDTHAIDAEATDAPGAPAEDRSGS